MQPSTGVEDPSPVPGLVPWLHCLGLGSYICLAACWAQAHGACELDELVEHFEWFARTLGVKGGAWRQRQALEAATEVKRGLLRAASCVLRLPRAVSSPVHHSPVLARECAEVREPRSLVGTTERRDEGATGEHLQSDTPVLLAEDDEEDADLAFGDEEDDDDDDLISCSDQPFRTRRCASRRRCHRRPRRVRPCVLADAEELRRAALCGKRAQARPSQPKSEEVLFERVREDFRRRYAAELSYAFGTDTVISPAPISASVRSRLMQRYSSESPAQLVLGYHGTRPENYPSIFARGLLIPGKGNGVSVANGSAYGIGIYTAAAGQAPMSKCYSRCDGMLVCGVLRHQNCQAAPIEQEDAASVKAVKAAAVERRIGRPPKRPSGWTPQPAYSYKPPSPPSQQGVVRDGAVADHGHFMVTFDEACVTPLFVVRGIKAYNQGPSQTEVAAPEDPSARGRLVDLWPEGDNPNVELDHAGVSLSRTTVRHLVGVRRRLQRKSVDRCRQRARAEKRVSSLAW